MTATLVEVGGFTLYQVIGEGAGSSVRLGIDSQGTLAAVKVPISGGLPVDQLAREAKALPLISSSHVPRLLASSLEGEVFLATELAMGENLAGRLQEGSLPWSLTRHVGLGLWEAINDVHAAGLMHRDVKPGNIIFHEGAVHLVDFGLASPVGSPPSVGEGFLVGTPGFLPPEALRGSDGFASDWWAWAATLVHVVSGHPAFPGGQVEANERALRGDPELAGVPAHLQSMLRSALGADPARRPTPQELRRLLEGEVVAPEPVTIRMEIPAPALPAPRTAVFPVHATSPKWVTKATVAAGMAFLTILGAIAPFQTLFMHLVILGSLLTVIRLSDASWRRTLLRLPGVALRGLLGALVRLVGPGLLGASVAWLSAFVVPASALFPGFSLPLLLGSALVVSTTWWGLGGSSVRSSASVTFATVVSTSKQRAVLLGVLVVLVMVAWGVLQDRSGLPDWSLVLPGVGLVT